MKVRIDMHVHTSNSHDGMISINKLKKLSKKHKVIACITDHNRLTTVNFRHIPGEEIMTLQGEMIGLFLRQEISPGLTMEQTLKEIKQQGGLAYLPHPYAKFRRNKLKDIPDVDIIEVSNGRNLFFENNLAKKLAQKKNIACGAGSDAHFGLEFGKTYIEMEDFTNPKQFMDNLKNAKIKHTPLIGFIMIFITLFIKIYRKVFGL